MKIAMKMIASRPFLALGLSLGLIAILLLSVAVTVFASALMMPAV